MTHYLRVYVFNDPKAEKIFKHLFTARRIDIASFTIVIAYPVFPYNCAILAGSKENDHFSIS